MSIKTKEILAIIPARGGSKGVKRKNIKNLGGKPLLYYSANAALKSKFISRIAILILLKKRFYLLKVRSIVNI